MPPCYTPIVIDVSTEAPPSTTVGRSFPVEARNVTIMRAPRGVNLRISFDNRRTFVPVYGGERFEADSSRPFGSVELLWDVLEVTGPVNVVVFAGDQFVRARAGDGADFDPPIPTNQYDQTLSGSPIPILVGSEIAVSYVRIDAPAGSSCVVVVNDGGGVTIAAAGQEVFPVRPGDTMTINGTAAAVAKIYILGAGE